jgi:F-type H+-transporting ATPase subunit delta
MSAAGTYAQLLLEQDLPADILAETRALLADPALVEAMEDPSIDRREKGAVIDRLFPEPARPFLHVLCDYGDWGLLPEIFTEYDALDRARRGVVRVTFTCCHEPTPEQRKRVEDLVCRKYGKTGVEWHTVLDPAILGGFILTVDDWVLDKSLRTMAEDLRRHVIRGNTL